MTEKRIKLEHIECEQHGCQYNITAGRLVQAQHEVEGLKWRVEYGELFHKRVMNESCNVYEKHCICVPILRTEVQRLKDQLIVIFKERNDFEIEIKRLR